jgi:hypothetical protein
MKYFLFATRIDFALLYVFSYTTMDPFLATDLFAVLSNGRFRARFEFRPELFQPTPALLHYSISFSCNLTTMPFLISNIRRVLNAVCFLLGNSAACELEFRRGEIPRRKHTIPLFPSV